MAYVALITDTHFGWKNDSLAFQDYFKRFYDDIFFPELERRHIKTIIHLGDLFDRRKFINFHILNRTRTDFLERLMPYQTHIMVGNHDTYFRDSNHVNAVRELVEDRYDNISVYEEPQEITIDGLRILIMPWLNPTNMGSGLEMITNSTASVLMGHLEIAGFKMDQTQVSDHGLDKSIFDKYKKVFSGHFHHASEDGAIRYLGAPYEYTFADLNDPKGFYIFDTDTLELEFIRNPYDMFNRVIYDDRENAEALLDYNFSQHEGKIVRAVIVNKVNPVIYDQWLDRMNQANPLELLIKEQLSLDISEDADEQFSDFETAEDGKVVVSDTLTILNTYIDSMGMEIDKDKMKRILRELYIEAAALTGEN